MYLPKNLNSFKFKHHKPLILSQDVSCYLLFQYQLEFHQVPIHIHGHGHGHGNFNTTLIT